MKKEYFFVILAIFFLIGVAGFSLPNQKTITQTSTAFAKQETVNNQQIAGKVLPAEEKTMPASLSANQGLTKPELTIDQNKTYQAILHTTEGDLVIDLDVKNTPIAANNFIYLAQNKFYDGTNFHRVIKNFMIQGGDPRGDGTGGPGYKFDDETFDGEYTRGTVAMANAGANTNGSQFFIMQADYPLPKNYVIFGHLSAGLEVLDSIANAPVAMSFSGEQSKPVTPVTVESVEIVEK